MNNKELKPCKYCGIVTIKTERFGFDFIINIFCPFCNRSLVWIVPMHEYTYEQAKQSAIYYWNKYNQRRDK